MAFKKLMVHALLLAGGLIPAWAQRVIVLPAGASSSVATALSVEPFGPADGAGAIAAEPSAFRAFSNSDGSLYFIVTTSKVVVVRPDGGRDQEPVPIALPVSNAAVAPNGDQLFVTAGSTSSGSLYVFEASGGLLSAAGAVTVGNNPFDVAVSADSKTAYVVSSAGIQSVDLAALSASAPVPLAGLQVSAGAHPGITIAPNGLIYVNALNAIYEIHPATLAILHTIAVGGYPGKPSFNPNATAGVVANQLASDPEASVLDVTGHRVTNTLENFSVHFDNIWYIDTNRIYASSSAVGQLFVFTSGSPGSSIREARFPTNPIANVVSTTISNETGAIKYLFVITNSGAYRVDLTNPSGTPSFSNLMSVAGPSFYVSPAMIGDLATVQQFNAVQSPAAGSPSLPLVIRLSKSDGTPLAHQLVAWTPPSGVTLQNAMTATNIQGIATATATVVNGGSAQVVAAFPGTSTPSVTFTLNVSGGGGGGDGGGNELPPGISVLSGNGLVTRGGFPTPEPMAVIVRDAAGSPVAGVPVTWTLANRTGSLLVNNRDAGQGSCTFPADGVTCSTDSRGISSVFFQGFSLPSGGGNSFLATTVTATVPAQGTVPAGSVQFTESSVPAVQNGSGDLGRLPLVFTAQPPAGTLQITGQAGQTLPAGIQLTVQAINPGSILMPNVSVTVRAHQLYTLGGDTPAATCVGGSVLSGANGIARCDLVLGNTPGTYTLYRVVGGYDIIAYTLVITAAPPPPKVPTTITKVSGDNQSGAVGQALPTRLVGLVKDQSGAAMPSQAVTWAVLSGKATLTTPASQTDSTGKASSGVTLGNTPGDVQIKLTAGNASVTFTLHVTNPITALSKAGGDNQTANTGVTFALPVTVQVSTAQGPAPNAPVTFSVTGPATLSGGPVVNTGADGKAAISVVAGGTAGAVQVTASAGGHNATFNLTVRLPGPQLTLGSFLNGASFQLGFGFGSIVAIRAPGLTFGLDLEPGSCLTGATMAGPVPIGPLATRVAGVEFQFGSLLAPIISICRGLDGTEQAMVQAPFELAPYTTSVTARYGAGTGITTEFSVNDVSVRNTLPGIFESGGVAVALLPDGTYVSAARPAHPGDEIRVLTTGLGPVLPGVQTNVPGVPGQFPYFMPIVTLNGAGVAGVTAEYARNLIGVFVVTFQIPSDVATGAAVPLEVDVRTDRGDIVAGSVSHIPIAP